MHLCTNGPLRFYRNYLDLHGLGPNIPTRTTLWEITSSLVLEQYLSKIASSIELRSSNLLPMEDNELIAILQTCCDSSTDHRSISAYQYQQERYHIDPVQAKLDFGEVKGGEEGN
jgi:hypothetical protein